MAVVNVNVTQFSYTGVNRLPQQKSWYHLAVAVDNMAMTIFFGDGVLSKSVHYFPVAGKLYDNMHSMGVLEFGNGDLGDSIRQIITKKTNITQLIYIKKVFLITRI